MNKLFKITIVSIAAIFYGATNLLASKSDPANIGTSIFEDEASTSFRTVKIENSDLQAQFPATEDPVKQLQKQKEAYAVKKKSLNSNLKKVKKLHEQIEELQQEIVNLKEAKQKDLTYITSITSQCADNDQELETLTNDYLDLENKYKNLSGQHQKLSEDCTLYKALADKRAIANSQLQDVNGKLTKRLSELTHEKEIMESRVRSQSAELKAETEKLQQFSLANKQLKEQISEQKKTLKPTMLHPQNFAMSSYIPTPPPYFTPNPMAYPMVQYSEALPLPQEEFARLMGVERSEANLKKLSAQQALRIKEQSKEIAQLKEQYQDLQRINQDHENEIQKMKEHEKTSTQSSSDHENELAQLKEKFANQVRTTTGFNKKITELQQQLKKAQDDASFYQNKYNTANALAKQTESNFKLLLEKTSHKQ